MNVLSVMLHNNINFKLKKIILFVNECAILIRYTILMYKVVHNVLFYLALHAIHVV